MSESVTFSATIEDFAHRIFALSETLPAMVVIATAMRSGAAKRYNEYVMANGEHAEGQTYNIPLRHLSQVRRLDNKRRQTKHAAGVISDSLLTTLVSQYDAYLGNLIRCMYRARPDKLKSKDKSNDRVIPYSLLSSFSSIEEAVDYVLEKEVESLLRKSHAEQFEVLESKLGVTLRSGLDAWPVFIELTERRNLVVHTDGKVSSQYLKVCGDHGVRGIQDVSLGDTLGVNERYFQKCYRCLLEVGLKLGYVMWSKLLPDAKIERDEHFIEMSLHLLQEKENQVAKAILEFGREHLLRNSEQATRMVALVNLAQAHKWMGDEEGCRRHLESEDWSIVEDRFKLAKSVLEDDFDTAATFMKRVAGDDEGQIPAEHFEDWPLFAKFRGSEQFKRSYEEVFGETFEVRKLDKQPSAFGPVSETSGDQRSSSANLDISKSA